MTTRACSLALAVLACVALVYGDAAHAAPPADEAAAQQLFDEGLALMDAKRYPEACARLEQSYRLDSAMGTKYRLAECFALAGLTGTAWKLYREVAVDARTAGRTDRAQQAEEDANAIAPRVPWLTVRAPTDAASLHGLVVQLDDAAVRNEDLGNRIPVDPGAHTITATADGRRSFRQTVRSLEGSSVEVQIPVLEAGSGEQEPGAPAVSADSDRGDGQRIGAIVTGSLGLTLVGAGIGLAFLASSMWDDALAGCAGGNRRRCTSDAVSTGRDANTVAILATVGIVVGGAAIVAAPVLWFTAPDGQKVASATVAVQFDGNGGGLTVLGNF